MLSNLKTAAKTIGARQTKRAILEGGAVYVFIAGDADPYVTDPIVELCGKNGVEYLIVPAGRELGKACGIEVAAACAAILR